MSQKPTKAQAIKLVSNLLMARRNANMKAEQRAYDALRNWCVKFNVNMENTIQGAKRELQQRVGPIMNSIV